MRLAYISKRMCMGSGTHTSFIGEQAALYALTYSSLKSHTESAADDGLGLERILKDHSDSSRNILNPHYQNEHSAKQE